MGYYIETPANHGKAEYLIANFGGKLLPSAPRWEDCPEGMSIICVVDNGAFEAAGLVFSPSELLAFRSPDNRLKKWLLMDREVAYNLAGRRGK